MLETIVIYHMNTANYDITIPGKYYSHISIGFVPYEKFMPILSGITVEHLSVPGCEISSLDVFPDMTVTEILDISLNDLVNTDGSERILADGATIVE
jgi:hypothetical protein